MVTSAFHTARTRWTFRRVLRGTGVEVRVAASEGGLDETNWYRSEVGIKLYLLEALKTVYYRLRY